MPPSTRIRAQLWFAILDEIAARDKMTRHAYSFFKSAQVYEHPRKTSISPGLRK